MNKTTYRAVDYTAGMDILKHYHDKTMGVDSSERAKDDILSCMELGFLEEVPSLHYKEPITREAFCEIIYNMLTETGKKKRATTLKFYFQD